jgi:hypothetical protein
VSAATLAAPVDLGAGGHPEPPADPVGGGRLTLERRLDRAWEGLRAGGAAECPVCRGRMASFSGGGACRDCGSELT